MVENGVKNWHKMRGRTTIKKRVAELEAIFENLDADKMKIVRPMLSRMAHLEVYMTNLEATIEKDGFVEKYENGGGQSGTKESTASRSYSTVVKNYNALARTVLSLLPETEQQEASDGLDEFLHGMSG